MKGRIKNENIKERKNNGNMKEWKRRNETARI